MSHVNVTINGRKYRIACEEGDEIRHLKLAETLEQRIAALRGKHSGIDDALLTVMAALFVCNELIEAGTRIRGLEEDLARVSAGRTAAVDRAKVTQTAIANALTAAAERIEKTTHVLNRTVGGGVAIG